MLHSSSLLGFCSTVFSPTICPFLGLLPPLQCSHTMSLMHS
ncbi:uncharacterized protein J3R85_002938 [Psidium guajava]|nr:uncharacterized protein J3R85_002938 [Psidium guajava]